MSKTAILIVAAALILFFVMQGENEARAFERAPMQPLVDPTPAPSWLDVINNVVTTGGKVYTQYKAGSTPVPTKTSKDDTLQPSF